MCFSIYEFLNNSIAIGFVTGLATGLYSSLVVTRYFFFLGFQNEILNTIKKIDYMLIDSKLVISNNTGIGNIFYVSTNFYRFHFKAAGDAASNLFSEISRVNIQAAKGLVSCAEYENHFLGWQKSARNIALSWRQILFFS